jgi:acyl-CoA dehydrogenase family protein 9
MQILNNGRFGMGAATGGGIRKLLAMAAEYANNRVQFGQPISRFGLIQEKFARMAIDAYGVESMAYMTTGLIDGAGLDCSVEAAACKIYGSEAMFAAINDCIQVRGKEGVQAARRDRGGK